MRQSGAVEQFVALAVIHGAIARRPSGVRRGQGGGGGQKERSSPSAVYERYQSPGLWSPCRRPDTVLPDGGGRTQPNQPKTVSDLEITRPAGN